MPITSPQSYLPTINEFIAHWELVNEALPPTQPLTVANGRGINNLCALAATLLATIDAVEAALVGMRTESAQVRELKRALNRRFAEFAHLIRALDTAGVFVNSLPSAPKVNHIASKFREPLLKAENIWASANAELGVIELANGYGLADFSADLAAFQGAEALWLKAKAEVKSKRADRNGLQRDIYPILREYRRVVQGRMSADSVYVASLPKLTLSKRRSKAVAAG
ncbi:hypothetical protein [Cerasicoccus fimbriatus]|uniref:hypothetical protein n=1 Tax=Cerasicoccus fimbriatus TaxID=3014554 RepID=UPI0022B38CCD|nr:hypothetical protein [Cerasicoccus sp. TK19100]